MLPNDLVDERSLSVVGTEGPVLVVAISRLVYGGADIPGGLH